MVGRSDCYIVISYNIVIFSQGRAEACTLYTEYKGPGLKGAREEPLYSEKDRKKRNKTKRKKVKKHMLKGSRGL